MMPLHLEDKFKRRFTYIRLSITDICNFSCVYCLPNGYKKPHQQKSYLSLDEINNLVTAFALFGVKKIRLTGGEPLIRRDLEEIISTLRDIPGIETIALSTNGYKLKERIRDMHAAGLRAVNVSVDTLNTKDFRNITGQDLLPQILEGIEKALSIGVPDVKLNSVLVKNQSNQSIDSFLDYIRYRPVSVRFIELMETKENKVFFDREHASGIDLYKKLKSWGWQDVPKKLTDGPAKVLSHPDYMGTIGLILPYSPDFCESCNRLRVTATGQMRLCLFATGGYDLRPWLQSEDQCGELMQVIKDRLQLKEISHYLPQRITGDNRTFSEMGG